MSTRLPTVTIGIPAYNEYQNLIKLINEILSQNRQNFFLENICVLSDGSADGTDNLTKKLKLPLLKILGSKKRIGKPARINQLFKISKTDLVIILDADIHLADELVLNNLVTSSISHKNSLISGFSVPNKPKTLSQKIAFAGVQVWDSIRLNKKQSDMYRCEGSIRAFPKDLYHKIKFPSTSADEAFSYIKVKMLGGGFYFDKKAKIYYTLPKSFKDYFFQQRRYLNSQNIQENNFENVDVQSLYTVTNTDKIHSFLENLKNNPIYSLIYLVVIIFVKISIRINPENGSSLWKILTTTK